MAKTWVQLLQMDDKSKEPARYVVAVSGGVDSVVLLHILLRRIAPQHLTVAHYDHGIREDSTQDRYFVQGLAQEYGLSFVYDEGRLGPGASEALARDMRYGFLCRSKEAAGAAYIVTAHHEDDLLETAVLNLLRGTGRKGLSSLRSRDDLYRPLLTTPKQHIRQYARKHGLGWREDSTNASTDYLRNYVRLRIMPKLSQEERQRLRRLIDVARDNNQEIDGLLAEQLRRQYSLLGVGDTLDRQWFIMLPHAVAREIVAAWLRQLGVAGFDRSLLERVTVAAKTYEPGKQTDINGRYIMVVSKDELRIVPRQ